MRRSRTQTGGFSQLWLWLGHSGSCLSAKLW